ncbi:protein LONGIFOLIA 2-like [Forsythia ovata]|uniref:Protein LONGIFOLIA 2-like n=1 Tax=Forsythia ovata TaxID=205694 RepID=A0ABD1W7F5_9LAMI
MDPMNMQNSSPQFSQQALDLWDVVKDSMYREVQGLSIKAKTIEAAPDLMVKFKDFPRPLPRITDGSQDSANFEKHLGIIMNWRELLRSSSYHSKDGSSFSISKDATRLSYDGRKISYVPFESQDVSKSTQKLKDLPILSLDSR